MSWSSKTVLNGALWYADKNAAYIYSSYYGFSTPYHTYVYKYTPGSGKTKVYSYESSAFPVLNMWVKNEKIKGITGLWGQELRTFIPY